MFCIICFGQKCVFYACFTLIGSWEGRKSIRVGIFFNKNLLDRVTGNKQLSFLGLSPDVTSRIIRPNSRVRNILAGDKPSGLDVMNPICLSSLSLTESCGEV